MKKLLVFLLLSACVSAPKKQKQFTDELPTSIAEMPKVKASVAKLALGGATEQLVVFSGTTTDPFLGWAKASVGFSRGSTQFSELQSLGPSDNRPYAWRVFNKWPDGSVRVAQLKTPLFSNSQGIQVISLVDGKSPMQAFEWNQNLYSAIAQQRLHNGLRIQTTVNQLAVTCNPTAGSYKILVADAQEITVRFRSHCLQSATNVEVPLSITSYFTMYSWDPVLRLKVLLGNDTLERPVQGGMQLGPVSVIANGLPAFRWVNESSYGGKDPFLSDGQQMAFALVATFDPNFSTNMLLTGELVGFQYWPHAQASKAFGVAPLPTTRIATNQIVTAHDQVDSQANFPTASVNQYLGGVNFCPGNTGAQADFASTMPLEVQKAHQGYSSRYMASVLLKTYRESYRPSFYFQTLGGVEDWVSSVNHPNLFFWSGRTHYSWSWNTDQNILWRARTQDAGFQAGSTGGWCPMDNQHMGHNHLRYSYELTGDPLLEDWLRYNVSLLNWNYFTDWLNHLEADRAFGRSTKEAVALTELFPDMPETALLKPRIAQKFQVHRDTVSQIVSQYGHVGAVLSDACDPRINRSGAWPICVLQPPGQSIVSRGWQTGFTMEALALDPIFEGRFLAAAEEYFLQDGTPKTDHLIIDPNNYQLGGIGQEWWTPWLAFALKNQTAPGAQFVINRVKPVMDARMQNGCVNGPWFCLNDSWRSW